MPSWWLSRIYFKKKNCSSRRNSSAIDITSLLWTGLILGLIHGTHDAAATIHIGTSVLTSDSNVTIPPDFFPVIPVTCLSSNGTPGLWITEQDNSVVFLNKPHELLLFDLKTDIEVKCSPVDGTSNITARISLGYFSRDVQSGYKLGDGSFTAPLLPAFAQGGGFFFTSNDSAANFGIGTFYYRADLLYGFQYISRSFHILPDSGDSWAYNTSSDILSIVIDSTFRLYLASGQVVAPTCPAGNGDVEMSTNLIQYTTFSEATFTFQTSALLLRCSGDTAQQVFLISSETAIVDRDSTSGTIVAEVGSSETLICSTPIPSGTGQSASITWYANGIQVTDGATVDWANDSIDITTVETPLDSLLSTMSLSDLAKGSSPVVIQCLIQIDRESGEIVTLNEPASAITTVYLRIEDTPLITSEITANKNVSVNCDPPSDLYTVHLLRDGNTVGFSATYNATTTYTYGLSNATSLTSKSSGEFTCARISNELPVSMTAVVFCPPSPPEGLTSEVIDPSVDENPVSVTIEWSLLEGSATGIPEDVSQELQYNVIVRNSDEEVDVQTTVSHPTNSTVLTNLSPCTNFTVTLVAVNERFNSEGTTDRFLTIDTAPTSLSTTVEPSEYSLGDKVNVTCTWDTPVYYVAWYKDGVLISSEDLVSGTTLMFPSFVSVASSYENRRSILTIESVSITDTGNYTCTVSCGAKDVAFNMIADDLLRTVPIQVSVDCAEIIATYSDVTTLSTGSNNTVIDGFSTSIQDMFGDRGIFFGISNDNLLLLDIGVLNTRRLLPFGSQYGDSVFEFSYSNYNSYIYGVQYTLSRPLPFFGTDESELYVNFYGFVSIGQPYTNPWRRTIFPLTGNVPMVASFWWWYRPTIYVHEYSRGNGNTYEDAVITMVERRLHQYPQVNTTFRPEVILSVTWSLNFAYIRYTTQMLIVSNGIRTYSLISFDDNNWFFAYWYSRYNYNSPVIGYSAGDGMNFETLNVEFWNLNATVGNTGSPGVWIFPLFDTQDDHSAEEDCKAWYDSEKLNGTVDFVNRSILNSCPCTIEQARANRRWRWGFRYGSRENCTVLWWPRRTGWRWRRREPIGTVECCYDELGTLIVGPRSGGTSKKYHFHYEAAQHINLDLIPYQDCCVRSSKTELCDYYYELRKSDNCSLYDEALAQNWGDPHFDSFDGLGYTFNGKGEFWLVQTTDSSISIQVRLTPTVNGAATFISAAAIQFDGGVAANAYIENNVTIVEISGQTFTREDVENTTYIGSDGTVYDLDLMAGSDSIDQLQNVSLILEQDDLGISISNVMGSLSATVSLQAEGALSVSSDLSGSVFQDNTRGLLGVINGDTTDDFTLPNGTVFDVNSTEEEIYYNFGLAWRVSEEDSLFIYRGGDTYSSVNNDTDFTPQFGVDLDNIPEDVQNACGGNTQCLFDYQQTGSLDLAMSTASQQERLNSVRTVLNTVPPSITGPRTIRVIAGQRFTAMYDSTGDMTLQSPAPQNVTLVDGVLLWNVPPSLAPEQPIRIMSTLSDGNATSSLTVSVVLCGCAEGGECIEVTTPNFGDGSYYQELCRCNPAYEGMLCENDIDGCKENPCQDPSLCEDVPAPGVGFNCTGCLEGYQLSRNMCDDIDECTDLSVCSGPSTCVNTDGSFQCICNSGYRIQGTECIDIDECSEGTATCDQVCVNNDGGFECQCQIGFNEDPVSGMCIADQSCGLDCGVGECVVVEGVNTCVCPSGSQFDGMSCANCPENKFGFNCSMTCNCMNEGQCNRVRGCVCVNGWTGGDCSIVVNNFNPTFDATLQRMLAITDRDPVNALVITLTATDRDVNSLANSVTYYVDEFTNQSSLMYEDGRPFFSLDSNSGEVRIQRQPQGDGPYLLTVLARDGAPIPRTSSPFLLVITVTSTFEEVLTLTVHEDAAIGTMVGRVQCSSLGDTQSVTVEGNPVNIIQLAMNGSVTLIDGLDYETTQRYAFNINCTEGTTSKFASVRISITDVNDNSPSITSLSGSSLVISENNKVGEIVGDVSFTDEDSGENGQVKFHVDPPDTPVSVNNNGEIIMTTSVSFEDQNMYSFTVTAVDEGDPSRSSTALSFTLEVVDVNDPPEFGGAAYVTILPGSAEIVPSPLLNISVSDDDSGIHDWVNVSVDIPWLEVNFSPTSQQVILKQYPAGSLEVGSADFLQHSDISPYLDGSHTPITGQTGLPVYLRGTLTAQDGGDLQTSVPIFVVIFPTNALVQVTVTTDVTADSFGPQAITMGTVFEETLFQRTLSFQDRPVYTFNVYSIEESTDEDNSLQLYGFFHNGTSVSGPIDVAVLPQNYHFPTDPIVDEILAEDYTRSQVAIALGTNVEYSVQGANVTTTPQPTVEPPRLSVGVTVMIVIVTFVATVILTVGIAVAIVLVFKAKAAKGIPKGAENSPTSQPSSMVMENYT